MTRSVHRLAKWTLESDRSKPSQRRIECASCQATSVESPGQLGPDRWALEHAGATDHREYLEIGIAHVRATPVNEP
ncbi:DUF7848 domain-containing protein [Streptomyces lasiicapitis]|uniref:DUF7848 domain-containing protein n=1 Tax=Streptomyces lasiicapitis TaxID=1923961 RepID=UPI0036984CAA